MDFRTGDQVMHSTYGLGQVQAIEERTVNNTTALYYMVRAADLTIWVPADENVTSRLRRPTGEARFRELLLLLSGPAEPLPDDRRQRNIELLEMLEDGQAESLCKVIRDLSAYRRAHAWNDYYSALMIRAIRKLVSEWSVSLSVPAREAETELHHLLGANRKG